MVTNIRIFIAVLTLSGALFAQKQHRNRPELDETTRAAITECEKTAAMPGRESGTRPTQEQMESFKECLEAKNVELPPPPEHREGKKKFREYHDRNESGQNSQNGSANSGDVAQ